MLSDTLSKMLQVHWQRERERDMLSCRGSGLQRERKQMCRALKNGQWRLYKWRASTERSVSSSASSSSSSSCSQSDVAAAAARMLMLSVARVLHWRLFRAEPNNRRHWKRCHPPLQSLPTPLPPGYIINYGIGRVVRMRGAPTSLSNWFPEATAATSEQFACYRWSSGGFGEACCRGQWYASVECVRRTRGTTTATNDRKVSLRPERSSLFAVFASLRRFQHAQPCNAIRARFVDPTRWSVKAMAERRSSVVRCNVSFAS